jgi:hypothetical protein
MSVSYLDEQGCHRLFLVVLVNLGLADGASLSARIRASNSEAGSSFGSCGTNWPEKAFFRMDWRRASACWSAVVMVWSSWSTYRKSFFENIPKSCLVALTEQQWIWQPLDLPKVQG